MRALANQAIERCRRISGFTEEPGRITRTFLSEPMRGVHQLIGEWMSAAGLSVAIDGVGNIRGLRQGTGTQSKRFLIASHLDTVPNAGAFDGVLGVVLGIALLGARPQPLPFPIEIIGFSEEEGVRFQMPFIGSRWLTGTLDDEMLQARDLRGITVIDAIRSFGLSSDLRSDSNFLGYLEFHIEQGPVLESLGLPLGVVEAIVGQTRVEFVFEGQANHAGTTPMANRRDALAAVSEWILHVERYAKGCPGLVATNGAIQSEPNAINVIPGRVKVSLDLRHADDGVRAASIQDLTQAATAIGNRRQIRVRFEDKLNQPAAAMDRQLSNALANAVMHAGHPLHRMSSGAGHDAMILSPVTPSAMLFLRSPGGISHHPKETVLAEDVEAALQAGMALLDSLESQYA